MEMKCVYDEVAKMVKHIYFHPDVLVKQWTDVECNYQLALMAITSLLSNSLGPRARKDLVIRETPVQKAIVEIVQRSSLRFVLEFDDATSTIRFRKEIGDDLKKQICNVIDENSGPIRVIRLRGQESPFE